MLAVRTPSRAGEGLWAWTICRRPDPARCLRRVSSLFEEPADRKRRCSNRGARSRPARVKCESMAYFQTARRRRVVRLVEDQHRAWIEAPEE